MTDKERFAPPVSKLGDPALGSLNVAAYPTAGQGLALNASGAIPDALRTLPGISVKISASQPLANVTPTTVVFDTVESINSNIFSLTKTTGQITVKVSGVYMALLFLAFAGGAGTVRIGLMLQNGVAEFGRDVIPVITTSNVTAMGGSPLNPTDIVTGQAYQDSGGALSLGAARMVVVKLF